MEQYIEELLSRLTLEEKIGMIHGAGLFRTAAVERLGIPSLRMSDGPMGVREEFADDEWRGVGETGDLVTYLPCNSALASTWNRELAEKAGRVLGREARGRGKDVILAPGINIKRSPLCGRNFEYMSEDPYLTGEIAAPMIRGVQSQDVASCVKHFAANCQEDHRLRVDIQADRRTLEEIYFPGFREAVEKGGVFSLMGAYNRLNGQFCCTSQWLLNGVLRQEWGFDGMIVSDWGGVHDTADAALSGLDMEMDVTYDFDGHYMAKALLERVRSGEIPQACIDEKIRNILRLMLRLKMIGPARKTRSAGTYSAPEHAKDALAVAEESIVLLKNQDGILPLDPEKLKTVAVIGANAVALHAFGGGSAQIKALYEVSPLLGIQKLLGGNVRVRYAPGYVIPEGRHRDEITWQATSTQDVPEISPLEQAALDEKRLEEALALARESDAVIFVGGLNHDYDVEGLDRRDMKLPYNQDQVLSALLGERPDTVVAMYAGSPVEMPWLDRAKALVWSYYAGMEGGTALARVLFGGVNPSGRLAETFLRDLTPCPAKPGVNYGLADTVALDEGVMVGYRKYDTAGDPVNFCFGHGLSYTEFTYSGLRLRNNSVTVNITNTGRVSGKETVQLYIAPLEDCGLVRPVHQLRGFQKLTLAPGETKEAVFPLTDRDFACYDEARAAFLPIPGAYEIQLGASSRDIRLTAPIQIPVK